MPVIINDFEIITQGPPGSEASGGSGMPNTAERSAARSAAPAETDSAPPAPRALDIRRVQEYHNRRKLRLCAH